MTEERRARDRESGEMSKGALSAGTALLVVIFLPTVGAAWWWTHKLASGTPPRSPAGAAMGMPATSTATTTTATTPRPARAR